MWAKIKIAAVSGAVSGIAGYFVREVLRHSKLLDPAAEALGMWLNAAVPPALFWNGAGAVTFLALWAAILYFVLVRRSAPTAEIEGEQAVALARANEPREAEWLPSEGASRHFRDLLGQHERLYDAMRIFDEQDRKAGGGSEGPVWAFRFWWPDGFRSGTLKVKGVPVSGSEAITVSGLESEDDSDWEWDRLQLDGSPDQIRTADRQTVANLTFEASSIEGFVNWMVSTSWKEPMIDNTERKAELDVKFAKSSTDGQN